MLGVTLFGVFLTPVFFLVIDHAMHWRVFASLRFDLTARTLHAVSIWVVRALVLVVVVAAIVVLVLPLIKGWR
jgi:hypothetical protein